MSRRSPSGGRTQEQLRERVISRRGAHARHAAPVVLIVDDTEDNRELFSMALTRHGYAVHVAVDGEDAVARAVALEPGVILMDLAMPNVDGFEATRRIRQIPALAQTPIVAVTASYDTMSVARALAAGCDEVLAKPCAPTLLAARVEATLYGQSPPEARDAG